MQKLYLEQVRPGMLIGQDIPNEQGKLLLTHGTPLTIGYIEGLRLRGHSAVWIMDGVADDVRPPEVLPEKVRTSTSRHLQDLFSTVSAAAYSTLAEGEQAEEAVLDEIATAARPHVAAMFRDAEKIVKGVANEVAISGVVSLKTHDAYTYDHSVEVAIAAVLLGKRLYMESHELEVLALGCVLHDLGKVMVPHEILNKPAKLSNDEFETIRRHPDIGFQIVRRMLGETSIIARQVARQHHERQDGNGYPQGLYGSNNFSMRSNRFGQRHIIPPAESAAVADVYSALASDRPYRPSMKPEDIITTMHDMAGNHLNRELVARFISILPVYPVCTEVIVISGKLKGFRGIVTQVDHKRLARPTVRILFDPRGRQIAAFEVDTAKEKDVDLATASYAELNAPTPA